MAVEEASRQLLLLGRVSGGATGEDKLYGVGMGTLQNASEAGEVPAAAEVGGMLGSDVAALLTSGLEGGPAGTKATQLEVGRCRRACVVCGGVVLRVLCSGDGLRQHSVWEGCWGRLVEWV